MTARCRGAWHYQTDGTLGIEYILEREGKRCGSLIEQGSDLHNCIRKNIFPDGIFIIPRTGEKGKQEFTEKVE